MKRFVLLTFAFLIIASLVLWIDLAQPGQGVKQSPRK